VVSHITGTGFRVNTLPLNLVFFLVMIWFALK
jgi:hypothetical protein